MAPREREQRFSDRMSDAEALMWNVEKDPWLNPSGGALTLLDRPVDPDHFRRVLRAAVARMPRLYERVVPGFGRVAPPTWVPDPEFDLDFHLRHISLPAPGDERQLFDLAAQLYQEPFDRTRPLWRFVLIDGLEGGRAALWSILHHAVADGIGQMRMAEMYQQLDPEDPPPEEVDLEGIISAAVEEHHAKQIGGDLGDSVLGTAAQSVGHLLRRQLGMARRAAGEVAVWPADPRRATSTLGDVVTATRSTVGAVAGSGNEVVGGSPLWKQRSRHRHLEWVRVPFADLKLAGKRHDASINDLFVAGMTEGAVRYHEVRGVEVDAFNTSFVVSTRTDKALGGNSFTPVPVQVPGTPMPLDERIRTIRERLLAKREEASHGGGLGAMSSVANLLPTSVVTRAARARAARMDFATSNLRGAPFTLYVSGAKVLGVVTMGPVAGTACNATAMSYDGSFDIGLFMDPEAIQAPGELRDHVAAAFDDIVE